MIKSKSLCFIMKLIYFLLVNPLLLSQQSKSGYFRKHFVEYQIVKVHVHFYGLEYQIVITSMVMHSVGMGYIVLKKSLWLYFKPKTEYA